MCITPRKGSFTLLCLTHQTSIPSNPSASNEHSPDLFDLRTENANLHTRVSEYQAQLAALQDKINMAQHLYYNEAKKSVVLEREKRGMAMKICVLEHFTRLVLESGMIDIDVDEFLRHVEETWLANDEKNDIQTGGYSPELRPRHIIPHSYPTSRALSEGSNPSQAEISPGPSSPEIRPYVPRLLHPLAKAAEGWPLTPCNIVAPHDTVTIGRDSSHHYFAQRLPVPLSSDAETRTVALTPEQLEALVSMERLVAPFSTDLGSLEVSSIESISMYSLKSTAGGGSDAHIHDADATLVTPPSLAKLIVHSSSTATTRKSAVSRTQISQATTKTQAGRSRLVSAALKTRTSDAIEPPRTSRNTSSRGTSGHQSRLSNPLRSKTSTLRPKLPARVAKPSVPVQLRDLSRPSTPLMQTGTRNVRAVKGNLSEMNVGRVKVQGSDAASGRGRRWV
uniref:Uncharacterized protein n=1 Tax=Moniliophthora roreri TaxID=221103 RepID=A0A0W0F765_MONRR